MAVTCRKRISIEIDCNGSGAGVVLIGSPCGLWSCRACTLLLVYCLEHRLLNTKLNPLSVDLFRLSLLFLGGSLLMFVGSDGIAMMATTRTSQCMMEAMTSAASGSRCNRLKFTVH